MDVIALLFVNEDEGDVRGRPSREVESPMSDFNIDKRDLNFVLFDQLKVGEFDGKLPPFEGYDQNW